MSGQSMRVRSGARGALAAALSLAALALLLSASSAFAASEPPVWQPLSITQPTNLVPGSPLSEVQKVVVNATGGTYTLSIALGGGSFCETYPETSEPIPWNASASEFQERLTSHENSYCIAGEGHNMVTVTSPKAEEYIITYHTGVPPWGEGQIFKEIANQPEPVFEANTSGLTGGAKTVTVSEVTRGEYEGTIEVSVTDVGGTDNGGQVTVEDVLPPGITATSAKGVDMFGSLEESEGEGSDKMTCSEKPETESPIVCTHSGEMVTGDVLLVVLKVKVSASPGNYFNDVKVSGGGAEPVSIHKELTVSNTEAGYGPAPGSVIAATSTQQAGAHPSVTTAFTMATDHFGHVTEDEKDIRFDFPPGLVGNTVGIPKCTAIGILEFNCPKASMVGMSTLYIGLYEGAPVAFVSPVYAIEPAPGGPAAPGLAALLLPVRLDTSVLSGGENPEEQNYGIRVTAPSLSQSAETFSTWITLWGIPAEHNGPAPGKFGALGGDEFGGPDPNEVPTPLLTNPQQCGVSMPAHMSTDSWPKQGTFYGEETTMGPFVGCEQLRLETSFTMLPDTLEAGGPAGYHFDLKVPQDEAPTDYAPSTVKTVKLALPVGTVVSPGVAWGLKACTDEQFGLHNGQLAKCPREAQVGRVDIKTPALLEHLKGAVYLATPKCSHDAEGQEICTPENAENGEMVRLFVQAVTEGESKIIVKLEGKASINQQTGQITAIFEGNPPLPFDEFELILGGGPRAALANPRQCGPATTTLDLTPWSTPFIPDSTPLNTFEINQNCFGEQFNPSFVSGTTSIQSGEYSEFTLTFGRSDQDGFLAGLQTILPPGLLGKIAGVTLCGEPQASTGECPENSLIGHVQALTGPGADPYLVTGGKVFLTTGYKGAPFGLSIVVPAVAGPYTLAGTTGKGTVVVRAAINVDKNDAHLTITADPLPTKLDGVPLQIKVVNVTVDRNEFTFNPTSCEKQSIQTTLTSLEGQVAHVSTPFQVTNCVGLGFNPRFEVSTQGKTSRADGASLDAKLIYPLGKKLANVKNVKVELPKQLPSRLTTLQKACPDHTFEENPESCPEASRIGQARAKTPVLPVELTGWAYFVSHGGAAFPNLVVVLQDNQDGVRVDLVGETFISKAGITSTTFGTVPDVPISEFELYLPEGPNSALAANGNLCTSHLVMPTVFNGQNGGRLKQSTPIGVTGCATASKAKKANKAKKARRARAAARHHGKHHKKAKQARRARAHGGQRRGK
jgi:hypothetical protein